MLAKVFMEMRGEIQYNSRVAQLSLESSKENTEQWTKMKSFNIILPVGPVVSINNNELIVAPEKVGIKSKVGLYRFVSSDDPKQGKWQREKFIDYPLETSKDHTMAYNESNQLLYIQNRANFIMIFDLNSKTAKAMKANEKYNVLNSFVCASAVFLNDSFNVIGGLRSRQHLVWNDELKSFSTTNFHQFRGFETGFYGHSVIQIHKGTKNKNELLLFGGIDAKNGKRLDSIYRFDGNWPHAKWTKLDMTLPQKLAFSTSVITQNGRFVILCGGEIDAESHTDCIYVYDVMKETLFESRIKCPNARSKYNAAILSDYTSMEAKLLCAGYLRQCLKMSEFPMDIVWIIKLLINREYLHLIQSDRGGHWRILVAQIISNVFELQ